MKILEYTFQHLTGYGDVKEKVLRKNKIITWDDYERIYQKQLNFNFYEPTSILSESKRRLYDKDVQYFVERLPSNLHFLISHSFPEDTIFLDIETTGLSIYYDKLTLVGWSNLNNYKVFINLPGESHEELFHDLLNAKCIVTFNGSIYDLPFLKKVFENIPVPPCHIDLRFFAKRAGYSGGQKEIENILGINRPENLREINGYEATILWEKFKEGDRSSLKKLIEYNIHDVDGMKVMFEKLTYEVIEGNNLPINSSSVFQFSKFRSKYGFTSDGVSDGISIPSYSGPVGPSIRFKELNNSDEYKVVGIDLTGSEKKASGWCLLANAYATTKTILTDEELIDETIKYKPSLISIDSPLSIPVGRISIFDHDPGRDEFGITRECERTMAKRGIKSYPCLIQSMQRLTERGISLAKRFRDLGYEVIESYPGAAQDIIGIPRKGKSLEYLIKGLKNFGVLGEYDQPGVTHDEIDAITSAIVGYFYFANQYEALGNETEGYLIVPRLISNM